MNPEPRLWGYLEVLFDAGGTDLLLTVGSKPRMRVGMRMVELEDAAVLRPDDARVIVRSVLTDAEWEVLTQRKEIDFALGWAGRGRLRGNAFHQRDSLAMALRLLPHDIPSAQDLGLPPAVVDMSHRPSGLVLITGPAGAGKSTTLASLIGDLNRTRACHILTIEDPIEYLHRHQLAVVNQREVGRDTDSFTTGLRSALRENPDVLMLGEMRDSQSAEIALNMAETGHLVFTTLHTNDTAQAIDRLVGMFPAVQQPQVCLQLANCLVGVVYQRMLPRLQGGQTAAFEVLVANQGIRALIAENKTRQLRNSIVMGRAEGQQTFEDSLAVLIGAGVISYEDALARSLYPKDLERVGANALAGGRP